jgi:hypothetical protein
MRNYWEVQMQNKGALSENQSLIKKVSKSKEVMECLRTCLKDSCQEMRSTKSNLVKALQDNTATKNASLSREQQHQTQIAAMEKDTKATLERASRRHTTLTANIISKLELKLVATERKHKRVLNTITKLEREKIIAKDDQHALDLEKKDNKIRVSASIDIIALLSSMTASGWCGNNNADQVNQPQEVNT